MNIPDSVPDIDPPHELPSPPAADVPGAIAATQTALLALTDSDRLETIGAACLQEFLPALRLTGGSGDEQRDGVAGPLNADRDAIIMTASIDQKWAQKIRKDLDGIDRHDHRPDLV
ncbi:MAG: hypothetical protein M3065_14865, partial [Actinomycetota bacterium]|nr:hypothetical protein [Actinomycetota bacterium]